MTTPASDRDVLPAADAASHAVDVISRGGLALVPFDVAYAFLAASRPALDRIYHLKLRPPLKACPVLASWRHFADISAAAAPAALERIRRVVEAGLPVGVLTRPDWESATARSIPADCVELLLSNGKLALFMNMGGLSGALLDEADRRGIRLFGSSANLSGTGNSFSLADVPEHIVSSMDIVCESGTSLYANPERLPSSIVDLDTGRLTRLGILHEEIQKRLSE